MAGDCISDMGSQVCCTSLNEPIRTGSFAAGREEVAAPMALARLGWRRGNVQATQHRT
jgi:hypothetical protein